jgi:hypothetical protein
VIVEFDTQSCKITRGCGSRSLAKPSKETHVHLTLHKDDFLTIAFFHFHLRCITGFRSLSHKTRSVLHRLAEPFRFALNIGVDAIRLPKYSTLFCTRSSRMETLFSNRLTSVKILRHRVQNRSSLQLWYSSD